MVLCGHTCGKATPVSRVGLQAACAQGAGCGNDGLQVCPKKMTLSPRVKLRASGGTGARRASRLVKPRDPRK